MKINEDKLNWSNVSNDCHFRICTVGKFVFAKGKKAKPMHACNG